MVEEPICKLNLPAAMVTITAAALLLVLLSSLVLILIILQARSKLTARKSLNLPPGSYGWPIIGEVLELSKAFMDGKPERFMKERRERYASRVFKTSILGENMAVLSGPEGNKFLFTNENKLVRTWWPPSTKQLFGTCLLTRDGEDRTTVRNMIASFVGPDALSRLYIKTMDLLSQQHINTHWQGKQVVPVFPTIRLHWFEIACRLFMNLDDADADEIAEQADLFHVFVKGLISPPINLPGTRFHKAKKAGNTIKKWLLKIVRKRKAALQQNTATPPSQDLLSHMLVSPLDKTGKFMSESEIVNNLHFLIMAGNDVPVAVMTMLMKQLSQFPEIYEKVLKEQQEIYLSKAREFLQWEDVQKMKYSWNVICESMRVTPQVQGALKEAMVDINYQGYHIPKGWKIFWSTDLTHSDPKIYPDYQNFNPPRFEGAEIGAYSYVMFGGGPRMCLGKEYARLLMLIFLHNVVTRFRWKLADPNEKIEYAPLGEPTKGLPIILDSH